MRESIKSPDNRVELRLTGNQFEDLTKGFTGVSTTFLNGVAILNGTSSYLLGAVNKKGTYSVRIKFTSLTPATNAVLFDFRRGGTSGAGLIDFSSATALRVSSGTSYVNGVASSTVGVTTKEIIVSGITLDSTILYIGKNNNASSNYLTGSIELIEIYKGVLTASEVANLYKNRQNLGNNYGLNWFDDGCLYNWYAASQPNITPVGCHVPTDAEWTTLVNSQGGVSVAGGPLKSTQTGLAPRWASPNIGATNASEFNCLAGGYRTNSGLFQEILLSAYFWTNTQSIATSAYFNAMSAANATVFRSAINKKTGFSIRFLLDNPATYYPGMVIKDIDGNIYPTIKIGTQVWSMQNLKTTR